jgi:hypothetical protein
MHQHRYWLNAPKSQLPRTLQKLNLNSARRKAEQRLRSQIIKMFKISSSENNVGVSERVGIFQFLKKAKGIPMTMYIVSHR